MRVTRGRAALVHFATLTLWIWLAGCGAGQSKQELTSGTGSVLGTVRGISFAYSPLRVVATVESVTAEVVTLNIRLCEAACDPLGINLTPGSRVVLLTLQTAQLAVEAGGAFPIGDTARAIAGYRPAVPLPGDGTNSTLLVPAISGSIDVTAAELKAGGRVKGSFQLGLDEGGVIIGSFDSPVLSVNPAGATL